MRMMRRIFTLLKRIFLFHFSCSHNIHNNQLWIKQIILWEIKYKRAFLIVLPWFSPQNHAFLIGFKPFLILFSYSVYTFYSFLIQYNCSFSGLLPDLRLLLSFFGFIKQLLAIYCFPVCYSPYTFMFFPNHCYFFLPLFVSLHSSEQIVALEWTVLSTLVNRSFHSSGKIQIPVGKHTNIYSIHFHKRFIIYY